MQVFNISFQILQDAPSTSINSFLCRFSTFPSKFCKMHPQHLLIHFSAGFQHFPPNFARCTLSIYYQTVLPPFPTPVSFKTYPQLDKPILRPSKNVSKHHNPILSFHLAGVPHLAVQCVILNLPGVCLVNSLTIYSQPSPHLSQSLLKYRLDAAVAAWPDVHQKVSPTADCDDKSFNELVHAENILQLHVPSVTPALPVHCHSILPLVFLQHPWVVPVSASEETPMLAKSSRAPPVIAHYCVFHRRFIIEPA